MGKILSLMNEKGGVGKSTLTFAAASLFASLGHKVLILDMDGQLANITYMSGSEIRDHTTHDLLTKNVSVSDAFVSLPNGVCIIPAGSEMADPCTSVKISTMKKKMEEAKSLFDYVFIDVSPSPDWRQALALSCTDWVFVVMRPDIMSLRADVGIADSIHEVQDTVNQGLKVGGVILNECDNRLNLVKSVTEQAEKTAEGLNTKVMNSRIRKSVHVAEAAAFHRTVSEYMPSADVSKDMNALAYEILEVIDE